MRIKLFNLIVLIQMFLYHEASNSAVKAYYYFLFKANQYKITDQFRYNKSSSLKKLLYIF